MSDLFIIGASGTKAYRQAMAAIAENIANASTEGYSRRSLTTVESGSSTATMATYIARANFGGTEVSGVARAADPYLDAAVRQTGTALTSSTARLRWMTDIEGALNDTDTGIGKLMTGMFQNIDKLAASPSDRSLRVTTLDSISRVAEAFQRTDADLAQISTGIATEAAASVNTINRSLSQLSEINNSLLRSQPGTSAYAQLLDSRDAALNTLSSNLNVDISFGARDQAQISYNGQTLVQGNAATPVALTVNADGTLALATSGGTALTAPASGTLGGLFSAASITMERRASLDTLAQQFVTDMNAWHAQGVTDAGAAGAALLSYGGGAASVTALITDPAALATKSSDGTLNGNLLTVSATLRGNGSVEQGWTALIATQANLLSSVKAEQTTAQGRSDQAIAAREAVSGVDLDMEAAELLRLQQAYSGSAKILQIAKETVDAILRII